MATLTYSHDSSCWFQMRHAAPSLTNRSLLSGASRHRSSTSGHGEAAAAKQREEGLAAAVMRERIKQRESEAAGGETRERSSSRRSRRSQVEA